MTSQIFSSLRRQAAIAFTAFVVAGCASTSGPPMTQHAVDLEVRSIQSCSKANDMVSFVDIMDGLASDLNKKLVDGVPVPVPVDAGGGAVHEQHKKNGKTIYQAGLLYEFTGEEKYLQFARDVLLDYADLYPTLGIHPEVKSSNRGQLFWQGLNEAMWLVYSIQGYEKIRDHLSQYDRERIENSVFNPMADFLSTGSPNTFDQIHNHATWAGAAVGMTGYVLGQPERVEQALYGLNGDGEFGFLRQLDLLFSPDGYYAEGPYYQRFALLPFVLFSQYVDRFDPDLGIFEYRDEIVLKAVRATYEQSYAGKFFPINDAIREKGIDTVELKYGVAIAYARTGDPTFLDIAIRQKGVVPTPNGEALLDAIEACEAEPYIFPSRQFRDGPNGQDGALMVLRFGEDGEGAALMKATTQGLGHGHHDKLGLLYFDGGHEVLADYGAARFLNVEAKFGGRYLPENQSWAKQTIAHNAMVVDETSHFDGNWREAQKYSPEILAFRLRDDGVQIAAAQIDTAYNGVRLQRVLLTVPRAEGDRPYLIDIMRADSDETHLYDLPMHFKGQMIEASFDLVRQGATLVPLGEDNGYQHLWKVAESELFDGMSSMSWLLGDSFYTVSHSANVPRRAVMASLGANDPNFNLRHEQALIHRATGQDVSFVTVFERQGLYDSTEEVTVFEGASVAGIDIKKVTGATLYTLQIEDSSQIRIALADESAAGAVHDLALDGKTVSWTGPIWFEQSYK